jgi:hypothetical protein
MKKWNKYWLQFICLMLSVQAICQSETFDIVTYTAPKDWKKEAQPGVVNFMNINSTTGRFCILTLYASTVSAGDAQQDFTNEWKKLVATPFQATTDPKRETESSDGWEIVAASTPVKMDGADLYVFLTVLSGHGKTVSIRTSLNDESYLQQMVSFLTSVELDASKPVDSDAGKATPATTTGSTGSFGTMSYTVPQGWSHQVFSDGVVFKPLDLPADEQLSIQIMPSLNFSGTMEQALQQSFDEAAAMYNGSKMNYLGEGNYKKDVAKTSFQGWEYIRCNGGVRIGNGEYPPEYGLELFVIRINNRFERVAVLKSKKINRTCSMSAYYADDRQSYKMAINSLLFSLQFTDGPQPLISPGTAKGGGIRGVWQGISMQASASSGLRYNVYTPVFLSNGQAYFGAKFPPEGLNETDTRVWAELFQRDWGTYTFSNGRGVLKMPYANIPLRMEGNTLIITANQTDHKFYQLPSVDGARFNGRYVMNAAFGIVPTISFTPEGGFIDNGAIRVLYHEYNDCINPSLLPGSGTYEIKDYTITFTYTDGRKIRIAFLGTEYDRNDQRPAVLRMSNNEDPMTRQ